MSQKNALTVKCSKCGRPLLIDEGDGFSIRQAPVKHYKDTGAYQGRCRCGHPYRYVEKPKEEAGGPESNMLRVAVVLG